MLKVVDDINTDRTSSTPSYYQQHQQQEQQQQYKHESNMSKTSHKNNHHKMAPPSVTMASQVSQRRIMHTWPGWLLGLVDCYCYLYYYRFNCNNASQFGCKHSPMQSGYNCILALTASCCTVMLAITYHHHVHSHTFTWALLMSSVLTMSLIRHAS